MTVAITATSPGARRPLRSTGAILLAFVTVAALSLGIDEILHLVGVYPPWGQAMPEPGLNLLALAYRIVLAVFGGYLAARFAPRAPIGHALILGVLGLAVSSLGAIAMIPRHLGPSWYPIALALSALPCSWLGGALQLRAAKGARP